MEKERVLTAKERAFILDSVGGTNYYEEEFGEFGFGEKEKLISSIFSKLELTYYLPSGSRYFQFSHFDFSKEEALEALEDLKKFKKIFEEALEGSSY